MDRITKVSCFVLFSMLAVFAVVVSVDSLKQRTETITVCDSMANRLCVTKTYRGRIGEIQNQATKDGNDLWVKANTQERKEGLSKEEVKPEPQARQDYNDPAVFPAVFPGFWFMLYMLSR